MLGTFILHDSFSRVKEAAFDKKQTRVQNLATCGGTKIALGRKEDHSTQTKGTQLFL